jgi:hypothetical protein
VSPPHAAAERARAAVNASAVNRVIRIRFLLPTSGAEGPPTSTMESLSMRQDLG